MRRRRAAGPIEAIGNGFFAINLPEADRQTLTGFIDQLEQLLHADVQDPRLRRLFPVAYHDDPDRDAEYQGYMQEELQQSRLNSIAMTRDVLAQEEPLTEAQLHGFMMIINNLRLVLGTLLDVDESADTDDIEESDPLFGQAQLYGYLGWLLEWTVSAMTGE
jgi:hypothetical protein